MVAKYRVRSLIQEQINIIERKRRL